ncbi:hypothetical protein SteCoe_11291 [Stentor coeruleus]|uniref:Uncharacterized protein n=1 Tax=Stentor coeruleus TaxID=5963 RepID=A0A1R2CDL2_9CILI|nr:hypothetical protein SteCoe_11291 [Stentor coeruleus]
MNPLDKSIDQKQISLGRWTPRTPDLDSQVQKPKSRNMLISTSSGFLRTRQQAVRDYDYLSRTRFVGKRVIKLPVISLSFNYKAKVLNDTSNQFEWKNEDRAPTRKNRELETGTLYKFSSLGNATFSFIGKIDATATKKSPFVYKKHAVKF